MKNEKLKITLLMDTSDNTAISIGLKVNYKTYIQTKKITSNKTQIILPMIDNILKKHGIRLKDISAIEVNAGPGSFTGIRVGLAIANALSFARKVPVNGRSVGEIILPIYK